MRFEVRHVCRQHRYSLGTDTLTGQRYLSIPVANRLVDYEEYYLLTKSEYHRLIAEALEAAAFASACRDRRHDDRLILKPGSDRGLP